MKQFVWIVVALLLACAGCARRAPVTPPATPSGGASTTAPVIIGASADETTKVLAELYVQGLAAKGRPARIVEVEGDTNALVSRIKSGAVDVAPVFAWTAAQELQVDADDANTLVSDLAAALDGEVAVLQPSGVDRAWRFVSSEKGASLDDLADNVTIVAPTRWKTAGDGLSGLDEIYHAKPTVTEVDDSGDRVAQVKAGVIGVFEATDPDVLDLQPVADPLSMVAPDPQVALLRIELSSDDTLLDVVQQLHEKLDNAVIIGIRKRSASIGVPAAVTEWLQANPLK